MTAALSQKRLYAGLAYRQSLPGAGRTAAAAAGASRYPPPLPAWPAGGRPDPRPGEEAVDILLPLGTGSRSGNCELRFALRSIEAHASGFRRVVVVGEDPGFLADSDRLLLFKCPEAERGNHESRIASKLARALASGVTTPHVAMWNDDYVLTAPVDLRRLAFHHKGSLPEPGSRKAQKAHRDRYTRALVETGRALAAAGRRSLNYDLHMPTLLQRDWFLALQPWWAASEATSYGYVVKSVYCNAALEEPGEPDPDCKLKTFDGATIESKTASRWVFSYADGALEGGLHGWLNRRLNRKSCFEK